VTTTTFKSVDYFFGAVFSCGPGYQEVTNVTDSTVSCAPCGAGTYNTDDTFAQAECFGCRTGQAGLSERNNAHRVIKRGSKRNPRFLLKMSSYDVAGMLTTSSNAGLTLVFCVT